MKYRKYLGIPLSILMLGLCCAGLTLADTTTVVSVSPASQTISPGQAFTINVTVGPAEAIAGVQFDLSFDSSLVTVDSVTEGNLLDQGGASTYFSPGTTNNTAGTVTGVAGAITTPGATVSLPGTFATISLTAGATQGTSTLDLSNVIVGDIEVSAVAITVNDGSVTIGSGSSVTWNCPLNHIALIAPYDKNGRPSLDVAADLSQVTYGDADWFQVLWLDESTGDWKFFYSEFTAGNTLTTLETDEVYYVVVSAPCDLTIPQG